MNTASLSGIITSDVTNCFVHKSTFLKAFCITVVEGIVELYQKAPGVPKTL